MFEALRTNGLERSRILVSNDDGVHAPGIRVLEEVARELTRDIITVAPEHEKSGAGHSLTLHRPLRCTEVEEGRFAVNGTPTDCVLLGVKHLLKNTPPDLVLSGINSGSNLGDHISHSGTIAAAMEGTLLGLPSIALSMTHASYDAKPLWETARHYAPDIIRKLIKTEWPHNVLMNVNFPAVKPNEVKGVRITHQGWRKINEGMSERIDPRGRPYYWLSGSPRESEHSMDSDLGAIHHGYISITPLFLELTHYPTTTTLLRVFHDDRDF